MTKLFAFLYKKDLTGEALTQEKQKDFRRIVYLQMLIILSAMLSKDILELSGVDIKTSHIIRDTLVLSLGGLYVAVLWDLLKNMTSSKTLIVSMFIAIFLAYVLALVTINPFFPLFDEVDPRRPYLLIIHLILFATEALVIYYTIFDIFAGKKMSSEKLWGSACIYLMIGISFGSLYDLINIANPGSMGIPLEPGLESYTLSIYYSMTIIGGHDVFLEAIPLIQNIGIIEAVWSNLFIVLLVGRLLGQPDADKSDKE